MTVAERENWIVNIQNAATAVCERFGQPTVDFMVKKYGAYSIDELSSNQLSELWDELSFMADDN